MLLFSVFYQFCYGMLNHSVLMRNSMTIVAVGNWFYSNRKLIRNRTYHKQYTIFHWTNLFLTSHNKYNALLNISG